MAAANHPSRKMYGAIPSLESEGDDPADIHNFRRRSMYSSSSGLRESVRVLVNSSFVLDGESCSIRDMGGHATIPNEVANIANNLIGCGVLSLSGGMAIYADSPAAVWSASLWIVAMGAIFGYFCLLIAKVCKLTGSATYRECWEETMGERGAAAVALVNALIPALGNLAYSAILSQTLQSLFESIGWNVSRVSCLLIITVTALLPLCLLKNLQVLAPFSVLGTAAIIAAELCMIVRCLDGSYSPGGVYYADISASMQPDFGSRNAAWSSQVLPFVCMIFQSFVLHYNVPRYYTELSRASIPRFSQAITYSFGLSAVIYTTTAAVGFLTFGGHSQSYILNNYSHLDPLATASRLAIGLSILLTYPLAFIGFRDGMLELLDVPIERQTSRNLDVFTLFLLTILTVTATFVTDLGLINAVGGGSLATALVFVFPALMYQQAVTHQSDSANREVWIAMALMVIGVGLGLVGVWQSIATSA